LRNITQGWVYRCVSFHCTVWWGRGYQKSWLPVQQYIL